MLAADHVVADQAAFADVVMKAVPLAEAGKLVTFGVVPTEPHTGYGYIKAGAVVDSAYSVALFKEKPDAETAANYLQDGGHFWNSGMFLFKASRYLDELKAQQPQIFLACELAISEVSSDLDFVRVDSKALGHVPLTPS